MMSALFAQVSGPDPALMSGLATLILIVAGAVIAVVGICVSEARKGRVAIMEVALKQEMVQRGLSADEIVKILGAGVAGTRPSAPKAPPAEEDNADRYAKVGPATCDIVANDGYGNWSHAVLLGVSDDQCLVHYVGTDVDSNEWIPRTRVRFPASVAFAEAAQGDWPDDYNAQEATVERHGEWVAAYVLMHLDRCYVHYVGGDVSENEWVEEARVRFSGRPVLESGMPRSRRNGSLTPAKPAPVEVEV